MMEDFSYLHWLCLCDECGMRMRQSSETVYHVWVFAIQVIENQIFRNIVAAAASGEDKNVNKTFLLYYFRFN